MSSQIYRSASKILRALLSASRSSPILNEGRVVAAAATTSFRRNVPSISSFYERANSKNTPRGWVSGALALPAAVYMLQDQEAHAAELERTFIAIKPDGVQRGLIAEIISCFERKGFKLVAIKLVTPSKEFAQKHYHDLKERPFFNGLCDFLSSGPVLAMILVDGGSLSLADFARWFILYCLSSDQDKHMHLKISDSSSNTGPVCCMLDGNCIRDVIFCYDEVQCTAKDAHLFGRLLVQHVEKT